MTITDDIIASLPAKPQARCNRSAILALFSSLGCGDDVATLREVLEDDNGLREKLREGLKRCDAPMVFLARLNHACGARPPRSNVVALAAPGEVLDGGVEPLLTEPLPESFALSAGMRAASRMATFEFAVLPRGAERESCKRYIRADAPARDDPAFARMAALYSRERSLYPERFFEAIQLHELILCARLRFGVPGREQQRRDVPDLVAGRYYVDVADSHARRSRHAFHHELFHMADFAMRGGGRQVAAFTGGALCVLADLEAPDREWQAHNPPGFRYGDADGNVGGAHMRQAGVAELATAPNEHFVNAYATSSLAEDKAEVWACMMCYRHALQHLSLIHI